MSAKPWQSLVRMNFQTIKLDPRMALGLTKIMKVREHSSRSGSYPQEVLFDADFLIFWIDKYVFKPLGCNNLIEFMSKYQQIEYESQKKQKQINQELKTDDRVQEAKKSVQPE